MNSIFSSTIFFLASFTSAVLGVEEYIQPHPTPVSQFLPPISLEQPHSGLKGIDCIYVINLDERPRRWQRTKKYFNERNCFPNRVSAVNGWAIDGSMRDLLRGPYTLKMSNGAIGCLLSHVSIFKDAYDRHFDTVWVCEDDIEFCADVGEITQVIDELTALDPDWDVLYTDNLNGGAGTQWTRPGQPKYRPITQGAKLGKNILKMHGRFQTHSMIYSRKGLKKALDYFTHVYLWSPIDVDIHYVPDIREYSVRKDIVTFVKETPYSDTENHNIIRLVQK